MRRTSTAIVVLALAGASGCEWFANEGAHGIARVELRADTPDVEQSFAQTERVAIVARYDDCLRDFYAREPEWTFDGDEGEGLFDGVALDWYSTLCDGDWLDAPIPCEVFTVEQTFGEPAILVNEYRVDPPLDRGQLAVGPLPSARLADCAAGSPTVTIEAVIGTHEGGDELWRASLDDSAVGRVDDPRPAVARVGGAAHRR